MFGKLLCCSSCVLIFMGLIENNINLHGTDFLEKQVTNFILWDENLRTLHHLFVFFDKSTGCGRNTSQK